MNTLPPEELKAIEIEAEEYLMNNQLSTLAAYIAGVTTERLREKWISVKDRLPEMNEECLLFVLHKYTKIAMYKGKWPVNGPGKGSNAWLADDLDHWASEDVTHWQPLPSPPSILGESGTKEETKQK